MRVDESAYCASFQAAPNRTGYEERPRLQAPQQEEAGKETTEGRLLELILLTLASAKL